jgi:hypothetical protein
LSSILRCPAHASAKMLAHEAGRTNPGNPEASSRFS